jgi:hypothetical protein
MDNENIAKEFFNKGSQAYHEKNYEEVIIIYILYLKGFAIF